jgi:3-deoxy-D-arabino-heptulosonate 7-phosphate (DAHP) synthase
MTQAPENPSTETLQSLYPFSLPGQINVQRSRLRIARAIENHASETLGIVGYCARPGIDQIDTITSESSTIARINLPERGLHTLHRGPMWKPRTNPDDWHGEETTDPEGSYQTLRDEAELHANVAVEIGHPYHLERYAHLLSFAWIGGRNVEKDDLITQAAMHDPTLPLGIKNGLNGEVDRALEQVNRVNSLRGSGSAPAVLIYRGGKNATSPEEWEERYIEVHDRTKGKFIADTAHGTEMAHDPEQKFEKSIDGQVLGMYSLLRVSKMGYHAAGSIMEASDLPSPTDPHMPLGIAIEGLKQQHYVKTVLAPPMAL